MFKFCPNCGSSEIKQIDKSAFVCSGCNKHFYLNSKPTSSVIPVYKNSKMLLCTRAKEPKKGYFDLIGGFLENGEDPLEGAVREFEEETGYKIDKKDLNYLGIWIDEYAYQNDDLYTFNLIYTIDFKEKMELVPSDDIAGLIWVPINKEDIAFAFNSCPKIIKKLRETLG